LCTDVLIGKTLLNHTKSYIGVILESDHRFSSHVKAIHKSAYYHLKNIVA